MKMIRNIQINNPDHNKPILADLFFEQNGIKKPLIIFSHGFKGFKDWGHWDSIATFFAEAGYFFVKFNFSHNGTTPEDPCSFSDLEAFSQNSYSLELSDLRIVLDYFSTSESEFIEETDLNNLAIVGHSRGGAVNLIHAFEDSRVKAVVAWAPIYDINSRWPESIRAKWRNDGVYYVVNARTNQKMPMDYQIVQDFIDHRDRLDVPRVLKEMAKSILIIHGTEDEAISHHEGVIASSWNSRIKFVTIEGAGHTFGGTHPFESMTLPMHSQRLVEETDRFLKEVFVK